MDKQQNKTTEYILDEIISPIFGEDYQNRVVHKKEILEDETINSGYLEQHIEKDLLKKNIIDKNKKYQTKVESNVDVLQKYQQDQSQKEIMENLPSKYLDFRDSLAQHTTDITLLTDNENKDNTVSQLLDDIFDNEIKN